MPVPDAPARVAAVDPHVPRKLEHGLLFFGEAFQLHDLLDDLVNAARAAERADGLDRGPHQVGVGGSRWLPVRYEEGPVGGSANYWMTSEVASLFHKAKNG